MSKLVLNLLVVVVCCLILPGCKLTLPSPAAHPLGHLLESVSSQGKWRGGTGSHPGTKRCFWEKEAGARVAQSIVPTVGTEGET